MKKLNETIQSILYYLLAFMICLMTVIVVLQVFFRYVMSSPLTWSEELARYLFVWITFLGIAIAIRKKAHVAIGLVVEHLPKMQQRIIRIINTVMILLLGGIIVYGGVQLMKIGEIQKSATLLLPMSLVFSAIPVSGVFIVLFSIEDLLSYFSKGEKK